MLVAPFLCLLFAWGELSARWIAIRVRGLLVMRANTATRTRHLRRQ